MLRPLRQISALNIDFATLETSERGGILSFASVSGMTVLKYALDPSGVVPLGFQYNDIEYLNLSRQIDPRRIREVDVPCAPVGVVIDGDIITDWVHVSGTVNAGDAAYVGPSGMVTNLASFSGVKIGYFLDTLSPDRHTVIMKGKGFTTSYMEPGTHVIITENNPSDILYTISDGFIKVRINQSIIQRALST